MRVRMCRLRLRVRVRWRRALSEEPDGSADEPLLAAQSRRLAPLRERLLRRVSPGLRGATLDLACGFGSLAGELAARVRGPVIAADRHEASLRLCPEPARRVLADASALPFRPASFDLVVTQFAWLWFQEPAAAACEVRRVLAPGGVLVAVGEPDFGGAVEAPEDLALAPTWEAALRRAGADPRIGRALPGHLRRAGFTRVEAEVFASIADPAELAALRRSEAELLRGLPLSEDEIARVERSVSAAACAAPEAFAFVPLLGLVAWA